MRAETLAIILGGTAKKGDVLGVARIAGIMAAKRTADLIPLCHPLPLSAVTVELTTDAGGSAVEIVATVRTVGRTGVEMEALTAASVAALTVYDMCKAVDRGMVVEGLRVVAKSGGASGDFHAP
jgi:cyclic pyranopterin phosphate synthase